MQATRLRRAPDARRWANNASMANYSSFFAQDLAKRCRDLLSHFYRAAEANDREVTLLLAVEAAGLVVPYERLSGAGGQPPLDRPSHEAETRELRGILGQPLGQSGLIDSTPGVWRDGALRSAAGVPAAWEELRDESRPPSYNTGVRLGLLAASRVGTREHHHARYANAWSDRESRLRLWLPRIGHALPEQPASLRIGSTRRPERVSRPLVQSSGSTGRLA